MFERLKDLDTKLTAHNYRKMKETKDGLRGQGDQLTEVATEAAARIEASLSRFMEQSVSLGQQSNEVSGQLKERASQIGAAAALSKANLEAAIAGEGHEFREMYPGFVSEAETEDNKAALIGFKGAMAVEEIHHGLYTEALGAVRDGKDLAERKLYVCAVCGNTVYDAAQEKCSVCGAPQANLKATIEPDES